MKKLINIIYLFILKVLFHIFSFFANVSNGGRFFVKKKILIGTLIIAIISSLSCSKKVYDNNSKDYNKEKMPKNSYCYNIRYL